MASSSARRNASRNAAMGGRVEIWPTPSAPFRVLPVSCGFGAYFVRSDLKIGAAPWLNRWASDNLRAASSNLGQEMSGVNMIWQCSIRLLGFNPQFEARHWGQSRYGVDKDGKDSAA